MNIQNVLATVEIIWNKLAKASFLSSETANTEQICTKQHRCADFSGTDRQFNGGASANGMFIDNKNAITDLLKTIIDWL